MRSRLLLSTLVAALLVVPLAACSSAGGDASVAPMGGMDIADSGGATGYASDGGAYSEAAPLPEGRSVIQSGELSISVDDPSAEARRVAEIVGELGGYVESQHIDHGGDGAIASAYLSVRVPAERLDEAFTRLGEIGEVLSQNRSTNDVTAAHVDLQARVAALEASIERLTELMSGSATTSDLLEAESALSERQQELDGLRAQLESLEGQVSESSLGVSLRTKSALPGGPVDFWDGLGTGWSSLISAAAGSLVLLGVLLPWLLVAGVIALVVVLIVRASRRRKRAGAGPHPAPRPAPRPAPATGGVDGAGAAPATGEAADTAAAAEPADDAR